MAEKQEQGGNREGLPEGWVWTTLDDVTQIVGGGTPSRSRPEYFGGSIPWLTPSEVPKTGVSTILETKENITELGLRKSSAKLLPPGTVLLTSRATIGNVGISGVELATNQGFASFRCGPQLVNSFLAYWFRNITDLLVDRATGTTFKEISKSKLKAIPIPLAPLSEQRRIVEAIEAQFTRLDAGVAGLERLAANLKRYRAAVLKAACEGQLVPTEAALAQAEGRGYEDAGTLLGRILAERRRRWREENPRKKYKEPTAPDVGVLPELPAGWVWATVEQVADPEPNSITDGPFGSKLKTAHYTETGPRVIRLQNIGDGRFNDARAYISEEHFESLSKHRVYAGDIVIAALGTDLPRSCIIPESVGPAIVKADCMRFKPNLNCSNVLYMNAALNSRPVRAIATEIVHGIGRPRLNQQEVKSLPIPLPPLAEQSRIVAEVERRLSVIDALEGAVAANLVRAGRLRQAILKQAFAGALV